ncbi:MAG: hypothetical protein U0269_38105 [Polyangiales bacterium]
MTLDLADVAEADRDEAFLAGLSPAARAAYFELLSVRDRFGYAEQSKARAAVRAALEAFYVAVERKCAQVAHHGDTRTINEIMSKVDTISKIAALLVKGTARVLAELDARGLVVVGTEPGQPWRVWTREDAEEAAEVFG